MQITTRADRLFRGLKELRDKPRMPTGIDAMVDQAVIATCTYATEAYLKKQNYCEFSFSLGDTSLRCINVMEMIRAELEELFGVCNIWVHLDESYHLGIRIRVTF